MPDTRLGHTLREARKTVNRQQREIAADAGISAQYLCDIELGKRCPPPHIVVEIGVVLGLDRPLLMWQWLRDQIGDEMADAMALAAGTPASGAGGE